MPSGGPGQFSSVSGRAPARRRWRHRERHEETTPGAQASGPSRRTSRTCSRRRLEKALLFTAGLDRGRFLEDEEKIPAISRLLEIIGEAAENVPEEVRVAPAEIPWRPIVGTRDVLIHAYFHVDAERLWKTVEEDLPPLRSALRRILDEEHGG